MVTLFLGKIRLDLIMIKSPYPFEPKLDFRSLLIPPKMDRDKKTKNLYNGVRSHGLEEENKCNRMLLV